MTITCPYCRRKFNLDPRRRQTHSNALHKTIAQWAREMGGSLETEKVVFKYSFGVWVDYPFADGLPQWPGKFVHMYPGTPDEKIVYMKSESAYTKAEEHALFEGVKAECYDAGINLDWLEEK